MTDIADEARREHQLGSVIVLGVASTLLAFVARKVKHKETAEADHAVRADMKDAKSPLIDAAVKPITVLSLPPVVVAATVALAWRLHRDGRTSAAIATLSAPVAGAIAGQTFTMLFPQPNPPGGENTPPEKKEATFPSGHTTGVTAEALSVAYVLSREGLINAPVVAALMGWPLIVGVSRIYRDRHWTSDVVAGWIAGTAVASASALLYETLSGGRSKGGADPSLRSG